MQLHRLFIHSILLKGLFMRLFKATLAQHCLRVFTLSCLLYVPSSQAYQHAVAMPDHYSAAIAQHILDRGGNAVDAAVAASFSLAVTYPEAGNLGGGGFMLMRMHHHNWFLDYRETAPARAHRDLFLDEQGGVIPFASLLGPQSSGVPGQVMGLWQAHQRFGHLRWQDVLAPAIELAEQGFVVSRELADVADWYSSWSSDKGYSNNFNTYFGNLVVGERLVQPELAATLKRLSRDGVREFYHGETADLIVAHQQRIGGLITHQDLANYHAIWREPVQADWQGMTLVSAPPPSSGGIALIQLLLMAEHHQQALKAESHNSAQYIHILAELKKRAYADRAEYLGDSDFVAVPIERLIDPAYIAKRAAEIDLTAPSATEAVAPGLAAFNESEQTSHFSIVDRWGNAVASTFTLNMPFGNGWVVPGAGFLMNNEMDDFSAKPGVPNLYGVIGNEANAIAPNKRMLSSMSPTLVIANQKVDAVLGTPGGSTIITSVFQTLLNSYWFTMPLQQAIDITRVHHQLWPSQQIGFHPELDSSTQQQLREMGYQVEARRFFGDMQVIKRQADGTFDAASDQRGRGESRVWPQPQ